MSIRLAPVVLCAALVGVTSISRADPGNPLTDRLSLSAGAFFLNTSTDIRVDGATSRGTDIRMESQLGLDDTDRFRADLYWRFLPRHKLRFMYFDTSQSGSRTINETLMFRDMTYPIDTEVSARFEAEVFELVYEYAFLRRERYELAGSVGVHNLKFELALAATGAGGGGASLESSATADGPLPVVGLRGVFRITDWLYADAQAQYFRINLDPYDGRLEDYAASLVWRPFTHVAFGAGYNEFVTRLDVSGSRYEGRMRWRYGGARLFINVSF